MSSYCETVCLTLGPCNATYDTVFPGVKNMLAACCWYTDCMMFLALYCFEHV
jgi:hypothetical protein